MWGRVGRGGYCVAVLSPGVGICFEDSVRQRTNLSTRNVGTDVVRWHPSGPARATPDSNAISRRADIVSSSSYGTGATAGCRRRPPGRCRGSGTAREEWRREGRLGRGHWGRTRAAEGTVEGAAGASPGPRGGAGVGRGGEISTIRSSPSRSLCSLSSGSPSCSPSRDS